MSNIIICLYKLQGGKCMFQENHYVPVIKLKRGERTALEKVDDSLKRDMTPLIEIQPVPFDYQSNDFGKTIDEHLQNIGSQIKEAWNQHSPVFIDAYTLYNHEEFSEDILENGQHPIEFTTDSIEKVSIPVIPVTGLNRDESFQDAIKRNISKYNRGACIRLEENDCLDIQALKTNLNQLLTFLNLLPQEVDLIIDYKQISPNKEKDIYNNIVLLIAQLPYLKDWRTLTFCSTAFPKNLNQIPTKSNGELPRTEWKIYKALVNCGLARIPSFGDYNISNPDFISINPRFINMAANIRYSIGDVILVFRGSGVKNNGFSQMTQLARDLTESGKFCGRSFSYGDTYIDDCANNGGSCGTAEKWVIAGVNHHLTLVARDLSNLHAALIAN